MTKIRARLVEWFLLLVSIVSVLENATARPSSVFEKSACDHSLSPFQQWGGIIQALSQSDSGQECQFLRQVPNGAPHRIPGLSPFWAQEYTGADLLREELETGQNGKLFEDLEIDVWDAKPDQIYPLDHGAMVANLIRGPFPSAVLPGKATTPYRDFGSDEQYIEYCDETPRKPAIINHSMGWNGSQWIDGIVEEIVDEGRAIVVTSAGNEKEPLETNQPTKHRLAKLKKLVVVGSLSYKSGPSHVSNYGETLTISAPSDQQMTTYDEEGSPVLFGATSGAAPQVSGALAAFMALTRFKLNTSDALLLLEKTALPIPGLPSPSRMGAGMLNSYRIGAVAKRITRKCRAQRNRDQCVREQLRKDETFLFPSATLGLARRVKEAFPDCSGGGGGRSNVSCKKKQEALKALREQALVNPEGSVNEWRQIACIHRVAGFTENAFYYDRLAERLEMEKEGPSATSDLVVYFRDQDRKPLIARWWNEISNPLVGYIEMTNRKKLLLDPEFRQNTDVPLIQLSGILDDPGSDFRSVIIVSTILKNMRQDEEKISTALSDSEFHSALERFLLDPRMNSSEKAELVRDLGILGVDSEGLERVLLHFLQDPKTDSNLMNHTISTLGNIGCSLTEAQNAIGDILLGSENKDPGLKATAARALGKARSLDPALLKRMGDALLDKSLKQIVWLSIESIKPGDEWIKENARKSGFHVSW